MPICGVACHRHHLPAGLLKSTVFLHMSYDLVVQCRNFKMGPSQCVPQVLCICCVFCFGQPLSDYARSIFSIPWHHIYQEVECSPAPYRVVATVLMNWMCLVPLYWSTWRECLLTTFDIHIWWLWPCHKYLGHDCPIPPMKCQRTHWQVGWSQTNVH